MQFLKLPVLLFSLALAACGGGAKSGAPTTPTPAAESARTDPSCPVSVGGTSVSVEDTEHGAALVFVTTGDVAEVRRRAASLVAMHNDAHGKMGALPDGSGGEHTGHAGHDMSGHAGHDMGSHAGHAGGMIGVHSKAVASEIDGGAKVTFIANAADVGKLQGELRMHAHHLASGSCAMGTT